MEVNKDLILEVAKNAKLNLTEEEVNEFLPQFKEILNNFDELSKINTEKVKPSFQPIDIKNVLREDEEKSCFSAEEILKNSRHKKDNYILGPKAL